jgi:hypothetical protein
VSERRKLDLLKYLFLGGILAFKSPKIGTGFGVPLSSEFNGQLQKLPVNFLPSIIWIVGFSNQNDFIKPHAHGAYFLSPFSWAFKLPLPQFAAPMDAVIPSFVVLFIQNIALVCKPDPNSVEEATQSLDGARAPSGNFRGGADTPTGG